MGIIVLPYVLLVATADQLGRSQVIGIVAQIAIIGALLAVTLFGT